MPLPARSTELKTGRRPDQMVVKTYKEGEVVFEEGTKGRELFIVEEGSLGVYKKSPEGEVELARIEKGGIIGEMSLLDNMARSATVRCLETVKLIVIDEVSFQNALKSAPMWLQSIIRIVVSRLRDANKRIDHAVLRDKNRGMASLMLLLLPGNAHEYSSQPALDFDMLLVEAYFVCRLKKNEILKVLSNFEKRSIISVVEDKERKKHICMRDVEIVQLYEEFFKLKSQKKSFKELNIPDEAIRLFSTIVHIAEKQGTETKEGTTVLKSMLLKDLENKNGDHLEESLLELKRRNLLNILPLENNDAMLLFDKKSLGRIKKIKEWVPRFEQDVS